MLDPLVILVVAAALIFDFINGFHDTANSIATSVLTRALTIPRAILMAAGLNFLGAFVSEHVATTIGKGIVDPTTVTQAVVLAALMGAIAWNLITWYLGLPSSSSHALIGGVVGAAAASQFSWQQENGSLTWSIHYGAFQAAGIEKILVALITSPLLGYLTGLLLMISLSWAFRRVPMWRLNSWFRFFQVGSAGFMAFSHGGNDAQKSMGIITMALVAGGIIHDFHVPTWVKVCCALAMALGTAMGGWRIIKTIGRKVMELRYIHGFAAETGAALVIQAATHIGAPISTTHVISSSIMGVGSSRRLTAVRWRIVNNILWAWVLTIPAAAAMGALVYDTMLWFGVR
ncbi:MAG: inorganic phosphate transporter [Armatimonadetes bacterium]|nr:inorganic phosphate transporter [Armatimonadota bacterium]